MEIVPVADLKPHPRNYRKHPQDQLNHIVESLREHGQYRTIAVAREGTILAGHGVVQALTQAGMPEAKVIRLDLDPMSPRALKLLAGDNEIGNLAEVDDRELSELLREVHEQDVDGLLGTGFDDMMLANLLLVTRPRSEVEDFDAAAEWVGMPDYESSDPVLKVIVSLRSEEDRARFLQHVGANPKQKSKSVWWPPRERDDRVSVKIEG